MEEEKKKLRECQGEWKELEKVRRGKKKRDVDSKKRARWKKRGESEGGRRLETVMRQRN